MKSGGVVRRLTNVPVPEAHVAGIAAALAIELVRRRHLLAGHPSLRLAGACLAALGLALAGWAVRAAGPVDVSRTDRLVTRGPYSITRNPMYLGWRLLYGGLLLFTGSRSLLRLLPGVLVATHFVIRKEERRLDLAFGREHAAYRARVRRYL